MEAIFDTKDINKGSKFLASALSKGNRDHHKFILLTALGNGKVSIIICNDFFSVKLVVDADVKKEGKVCIDANSFMNLVRTSLGNCKITENERIVTIQLDDGSYELTSIGVNSFLKNVGDISFDAKVPKKVMVETDYFKYKVGTVSYCLSNDLSIPALQNIFIHKKYMIGCNGSYGAFTKLNFGELNGAMLNKNVLSCINNITDEEITLFVKDNKFYGKTNSMEFICFMSNDEYPIDSILKIVNRLKKVKENKKGCHINFNVEKITESLCRLVSISDKQYTGVKVSFTKKHAKIRNEAYYGNQTKGVENVLIKGKPVESMEITTEGRMLLRMISVFNERINWDNDDDQGIQYLSDDETLQFFKPLL